FRLKSSSPAIKAGAVIAGITEDFTGAARHGAPDIGALEFSDSSSNPDPDPPEPPSLARSENMTGSSDNFASDHGVNHLWDTCTESTPACTSGSGSAEAFWVEFDFGEVHRLTSARLFGDADDAWVSSSWSLFYKNNVADPWSEAFVDAGALVSGWVSEELVILARFARVEVKGNVAGTGTQARELEIHGVPESCSPTEEICDGVDNDCDGKVDEEWPSLGAACSSGLGACSQAGVLVCDAEAQGTTCSAVALTPAPEVCDDGADNDCDGKVDAADADCQTGVCPENYVAVTSDEIQPHELTVVVHDAEGKPVRCGRIAVDLDTVGCSGGGGFSLMSLLPFLCMLVRARRFSGQMRR
ncbi:MAG: MopE-related protein, partial [Myxococcota bacterium]